MKARYIIIDEQVRNNFEKKWQIPYGYSGCFMTFDLEEAIYRSFNGESVEKVDEEGREIVYIR